MADVLLDALFGGVIFWCGIFMGLHVAKARKDKTVSDPSICSCKHPYSQHKNSGDCNVTTVRYNDIREIGRYNCACVRYDGVPPPHIFMKDM